MITIFHNNKCGKSRCALAALQEKNIEFQLVEYLKNTPSVSELKSIIQKLGIKPYDLIRSKEAIFIENFKGKTYSDDEWIRILHENPILIERPILIKGDKAVIARSDEKINEFLENN